MRDKINSYKILVFSMHFLCVASLFCYADIVDHKTIEMPVEDLVMLHYNLGVSLSFNNECDKAIEQFERVLSIQENNADAHYNLGYLAYFYSKNLVKAHQHFQKYLDIIPNAPELSEISSYLGEIEVALWLDSLQSK